MSLDVMNWQENTATSTRWHLINGNRSDVALDIGLAALHMSKGKELQGRPAKYG